MAYSDYGSFVYMNGVRRVDKEDVGVFDTDEGNIPSGARIFVNILKRKDLGDDKWYNHSHHGVLGDKEIRVACYKQGFPMIYKWCEEEPEIILDSCLVVERLNLLNKDYVGHYFSDEKQKEIYYIDYDYPCIEFEYKGYKFTFTSSDYSGSGHYETEMIEPDGTKWECIYDYGFGAGITD